MFNVFLRYIYFLKNRNLTIYSLGTSLKLLSRINKDAAKKFMFTVDG